MREIQAVRRLCAISCLLTLALGGCAVIGDHGPVVGLYAGLVGVRASARPAVSAARTDVSVLGVWLGDDGAASGPGGGLGWHRSQRVLVGADSRLVIIVKSDKQLVAAQDFLTRTSMREGSCVLKP